MNPGNAEMIRALAQVEVLADIIQAQLNIWLFGALAVVGLLIFAAAVAVRLHKGCGDFWEFLAAVSFISMVVGSLVAVFSIASYIYAVNCPDCQAYANWTEMVRHLLDAQAKWQSLQPFTP